MVFGLSEPTISPAEVRSLRECYVWYDYFGMPQLHDTVLHGDHVVSKNENEHSSGTTGDPLDSATAVVNGQNTGAAEQRDARIAQWKARCSEQGARTPLELLRASMESLPAYVQASEYFVVLAPHLRHRDTSKPCTVESWNRRGWCRVEQSARALSTTSPTHMLTLTAKEQAVEAYPFSWVFASPRAGDFAVETDRVKVDKIMAQK